MSQTVYAGIDYSLGKANVDPATGIHFGVISQHTVGGTWYESAEPDYGPAMCGHCGNLAIASDDPSIPDDAEWNKGMDYACLTCARTFWSDEAFAEEPRSLNFEDSEYTLTDCLDSDIFVLRSPYYTRAQFCSPCVPGAGDLNSPCETGPKTFCLGHEWYWDTESERAPYPVYRVADDTLVEPVK